ncbi:MAG: AAA-like domain-containing protein [Nostoc sp. EkiNYC01]|nr:AAA-like domain-containing protein [Nostoc sp. EkiNYC01]
MNVGITITLPPFTPKQVQDLALRYGLQDAIAASKLESMGLVQLNGNQACVMCELYRLDFSQQLAKHSGC